MSYVLFHLLASEYVQAIAERNFVKKRCQKFRPLDLFACYVFMYSLDKQLKTSSVDQDRRSYHLAMMLI